MQPQVILGSVSPGRRRVGADRRAILLARAPGRPRAEALRPLLLLHAFRFVGLAFVVPGVVSSELPAAFARPAAYGDLATSLLALAAFATLRRPPGIMIVWLFNIVGTVDLLNAFYQGDRLGVAIAPGLQGAAYFIPTALVPLLLVTHALVFRIISTEEKASLSTCLIHVWWSSRAHRLASGNPRLDSFHNAALRSLEQAGIPQAPTVSPVSKMLPLDVRADDSVRECVEAVVNRSGRLDVVINNAGYELAGASEELSSEEARVAQFETNFFGVVRMVNAVLPLMRHQQRGHIINVSSLTGLTAIPFLGIYSASKFALEKNTEALRYVKSSLSTFRSH